MDLLKKNGEKIERWQDWEHPKKEYQWKEGRSAMELAKSWFRSSMAAPPEEIIQIISNHFQEEIEFIRVIPELSTPLPERGEGRNHDVASICRIGGRQSTVCIEGKADEPFGEFTIAHYYQQMRSRQVEGDPTRVPERIEKLIAMLPIVQTGVASCAVSNNGYQLLTALAGTALQARIDKSDLAILIIHQFQTADVDLRKIEKSIEDFTRFVGAVTSVKNLDSSSGVLYGPVEVAGVACYIGRVVA